MGDLYEKLKSNRRGLSWIMGKMPGFRGYMEMTTRRTADRMMRDHIAAQLKLQHSRLAGIEANLVRAGGLSYMDEAKSLKTKFQTLIDRIATDAPGYSGFWAANSIGPDELEEIYMFDEAMLRYVDQIGELVDAFENAVNNGEGIPEAIAALDMTMIEANNAYSLRDDIVKGIA
jgi:hypothetical protein